MRRLVLALLAALATALAAALPAGADISLAPGPNLAPYGVPQGMSIGDLDGDGHLDVVTTDGQLEAYRGDGTGGFARSYRSTFGWLDGASAPMADFDGDGHLDVAVAGGYGWNPVTFFGDGEGKFSDGPSVDSGYTGSRWLAVGRINSDPRDDLVVATHGDPSGGAVHVFLGRADRMFDTGATFDVPPGASDLAIGDVNGDGALDLVIATGADFRVALGARDAGGPTGLFGAPTTYETPTDVVGLTDLSDDGRDDIVALSRADNMVRVRLGTAHGPLSAASEAALASAVTAADVTFPDLDADGAPDVAVAGWGDALQVLFSDAAGGLEDATAFPALQYSRIRSVVAGDFNEDGVDDVVVGDDYNTRMFMMRNAPVPVSPTAEIDFGEQRVGAGPATKTVELANGGVAPLDVAQISVLGEGFGAGRDGCTGARLQYGEACSGDVIFMATEPGDYEGALELSSNAADSLLYLPLFGTGVAPPPSSPPASPTSPGAATTTPAPATGSSGPTVTPVPAKSANAVAAAAVAALRRLGLAGLARGRTQKVSVAVSAGSVTIVARTRGRRRTVIARSESTARGLRIRATARGRRLARRAKRLKLDVLVTFKPVSGPVQKASARATLVAGRRP